MVIAFFFSFSVRLHKYSCTCLFCLLFFFFFVCLFFLLLHTQNLSGANPARISHSRLFKNSIIHPAMPTEKDTPLQKAMV